MAYTAKALSVLAYANGFTLWHYATTDAATEVDTSNYFSKAADMLRPGDIVIANLETNAMPKTGMLVVKQSQPGLVDVSDLTLLGSINTD
jgi:hypothetical protein